MKPFFITATSTDIGKTFVTCALTVQLQAQNKKVKALKPIASGFDATHAARTDTGQLLQAQRLMLSQAHIDSITPWRFSAYLSPDMAAEADGKSVDFAKLIAFCHSVQDAEYLLVEGAGGVMTPISATHTILDWMAALNFPVILVTGSYLGSITHTLTAAQMLLARKVPLQGIIISESRESAVPLTTLRTSLQRFLPKDIRWAEINRLDSAPPLWKYAPNLMHMLS